MMCCNLTTDFGTVSQKIHNNCIVVLKITLQVHSRFPITRFPVTKPLFNERVTPPYNEQTIDPSSPTTTE